jgi:predicted TIM-barrel fold metal-dependent hydrolase
VGSLHAAGYPQWQADELGAAKAAGAKGVKILKTLGLYLREQISTGPLVPIDDKRFDPMWEACAALGFPVSIHIADPKRSSSQSIGTTSGSRS